METFYMTDQPETCRKCGTRTDIIIATEITQVHQCPQCNYQYRVIDEEHEDEFNRQQSMIPT